MVLQAFAVDLRVAPDGGVDASDVRVEEQFLLRRAVNG